MTGSTDDAVPECCRPVEGLSTLANAGPDAGILSHRPGFRTPTGPPPGPREALGVQLDVGQVLGLVDAGKVIDEYKMDEDSIMAKWKPDTVL